MRPLVHRVDHVYVVLDDAEAAHRLLVEDLGLAVAWAFQSYGGFASGGVNLGNLNLEFVAAAGGRTARSPARITGIAFEPDGSVDDDYLAELDRRGIPHGPAIPTPAWTNVPLAPSVCGGVAFVCDYAYPGAKDPASPLAWVELFERSGHQPFHDEPTLFVSAIKRWLAGAEAPAT